MNKKRLPLLIVSVFLGGLSTAALADIDPQVCRELVDVANSSQTIPNSVLNAYGADVQPCLSACGNLYGDGVDPDTLNSISVCRKTLSSLAFENNAHSTTVALQSQESPQATLTQAVQNNTQTNVQLPQANLNTAVNVNTNTANSVANTDTNSDSSASDSNASTSNNNASSTDNNSADNSQTTNDNNSSNQQNIRWF